MRTPERWSSKELRFFGPKKRKLICSGDKLFAVSFYCLKDYFIDNDFVFYPLKLQQESIYEGIMLDTGREIY